MIAKINLTLTDLMLYLRQSLLKAREQEDAESLVRLSTVFDVLEEAASADYATRDGRIIGILMELECAARDSLQGEDWKSDIPSVEQIEAATSSS